MNLTDHPDSIYDRDIKARRLDTLFNVLRPLSLAKSDFKVINCETCDICRFDFLNCVSTCDLKTISWSNANRLSKVQMHQFGAVGTKGLNSLAEKPLI